MKQLSYIHAESQVTGELKYGTFEMIDYAMPMIVLAPRDPQP